MRKFALLATLSVLLSLSPMGFDLMTVNGQISDIVKIEKTSSSDAIKGSSKSPEPYEMKPPVDRDIQLAALRRNRKALNPMGSPPDLTEYIKLLLKQQAAKSIALLELIERAPCKKAGQEPDDPMDSALCTSSRP